jgi:hypothetical protein
VTSGVALIFGGALLGVVGGWFGTAGFLALIGQGHSHSDMFTVFGGALLGAPAGAVLLRVVVWWRARRRARSR